MGLYCALTAGILCVSGYPGDNIADYNNFGIGLVTTVEHKSIRNGTGVPAVDWKASYTVTDVIHRADASKLPSKCVGGNCIGYSVRCDVAAPKCTYAFVLGTAPLTVVVEGSNAAALELAQKSLAVMPDAAHPIDNVPFADFTPTAGATAPSP